MLITRREGGRGTNAINTRPSIKTRSPNLYSAERFFFFTGRARRFRPNGRFFFFVAPTTRTITRLRYVRLRGVTRVVFPIAHVSVFSRSISNISDANSYQMRTSTKSYATKIPTRCGHVACLSTWCGQKSILSEILRWLRSFAIPTLGLLSSTNRVLRERFYIVFLKIMPGWNSYTYLCKLKCHFIGKHFRENCTLSDRVTHK